MASLQNLQPVKTQKVLIALNRTPARIRMMIKHRQLDLLHRSLIYWRRAGVINDPVLRAVGSHAGLAKKNHHVIRKLLDPRLVKEEQVAGHGFPAVSRNKQTIKVFQRATVGEFREPAVAQVAFVKRSEVSP